MKLFILLGLNFLVGQTTSYYYEMREAWEAFKTKYNKIYESEIEEEFRMKIYAENAYRVERHNKLYMEGIVDYEQGLNEYSDMLPHEFFETMNGYRADDFNETAKGATIFIPPANVELPKKIDWRKKGGVTPIKNQNPCGSCYSFGATGALEGQHFRKTGKLVSLSEQNLIDCTKGGKYGNQGCDGGTVFGCYHYVIDNKGIDTEESYSYKAIDTEPCLFKPENVGATVRGVTVIKEGDEEDLKAAVATQGPVAVGIDADHDSFMNWVGKKVYYEPECSSTELSHAVLVVGYGTTKNGTDYWLVKNSWGTSWGDEGYIKMARNRNNHCGIASTALFPIV